MASVARRIVLTGAESTGKTTLAGALAAHYRVLWVPEYAREYAASKMGPLTIEDVEPIARGQLGLETSYRETAGERATLIFDTDLLSTWVYAHHYYGAAPDWIDERLRRTSAAGALYLLCDTDLPWVEDPIRDRVAARQEIQARFRDQLIDRVLPFEALRGIGSDRLAAAIQAIDARFGSLSA